MTTGNESPGQSGWLQSEFNATAYELWRCSNYVALAAAEMAHILTQPRRAELALNYLVETNRILVPLVPVTLMAKRNERMEELRKLIRRETPIMEAELPSGVFDAYDRIRVPLDALFNEIIWDRHRVGLGMKASRWKSTESEVKEWLDE